MCYDAFRALCWALVFQDEGQGEPLWQMSHLCQSRQLLQSMIWNRKPWELYNFPYCNECYPTSHNKQWHKMSMCFQRCKYSSCTCEKSEECLCTVFSSYARACAAKGIFLQGWRGIVCGKKDESCLFGRQMMGFQTRLFCGKFQFKKIYEKSI